MDDRNTRRRSRSESPRDDSRNRYGNRSSPRRRLHREYSTEEGRDRSFRRERHCGDRENPEESRCLGVFGMSTHTKEQDLRDVFKQFGEIEKINIVCDPKRHLSRGFGFIYYKDIADAKEALKHCHNIKLDGKSIRVDFSVTRSAHSPTPGIYMGKSSYDNYGGRGRRGRGDGSSRYDSRNRRDSYRGYEGGSGRSHSNYRVRSYSRSPRR